MARRSPPLERFDMTAPVAAEFARPPMDDGDMARAAGRAAANVGNMLARLAGAAEARRAEEAVKAAAAEGARDGAAAVTLPRPQAAAPQGDGDDALALIRRFEGFRATPYWDVNAYRAGYGSDTVTGADGRVRRVVPGMTVSREDAERDLARRAAAFAATAARQVGRERWDALPGHVRAALTSVAYNYGSLPSRILGAVRSGDPAAIAAAVRGLGGDNKGVNARRRDLEARHILGAAAPAQPALPAMRPLQLRKSGRPQDDAYDAAALKAGAYNAKTAMIIGLARLDETYGGDPVRLKQEAAKLLQQYVEFFRDDPQLAATARAEFLQNWEPIRRRAYDRRDAAADKAMKAAALEALTAQGALLEKQAYAIGVNDDGDARLAALSERAMTVIDSALAAGAIDSAEAAAQRQAVVRRLLQARFDGVFDALATPAEKQDFAARLAAPAMRDELLQKLDLDDYRALAGRYDMLARRAAADADAAMRMERPKLKALLDDDIASLAATGQPLAVGGLPLDPAHVAAVMGEDEARKWQAARNVAGQLFAATDGMAQMTAEQIAERLRGLAPAAGSEGFADRQDVFDKAAKTADAILKKRAEDPALAAEESFAELRDEGLRQNPEKLARARLEAQEALGIPALARQPLTNAEARRMADRLTLYRDDAPAQAQAIDTLMGELRLAFGAYAPLAAAQVLRANNVSKDTATAAVAVLDLLQQGEMPQVRDVRRLQGAVRRDLASEAMEGRRRPTNAPLPRTSGPPQPAPPRPTNAPGPGRSRPPPSGPAALPNALQVELLRKNADDPKFIEWFDQKFGKGAAQSFLAPPSDGIRRRQLDDGSQQLIWPNGWVETFHPDGGIDGMLDPSLAIGEPGP
jgi:GH24 family phage-related lysozyme (muramidase)